MIPTNTLVFWSGVIHLSMNRKYKLLRINDHVWLVDLINQISFQSVTPDKNAISITLFFPTMQHHTHFSNRPAKTPPPLVIQHREHDCLLVTVNDYTEATWFLKCSQALSLMEINFNGNDLLAYLPLPKALIITDEEKLYKSIAACLLSLYYHQWALESIEEDTFCLSNEGEQICTLSPPLSGCRRSWWHVDNTQSQGHIQTKVL